MDRILVRGSWIQLILVGLCFGTRERAQMVSLDRGLSGRRTGEGFWEV